MIGSTKENSNYDKRSFKINLTPDGHKIYNNLIKIIENDINRIFNCFDIDEKDQMIELLSKINWQFEIIKK